MSKAEDAPSRIHWPVVLLSLLTFLVVCSLPYVRWWAYPSLFDDDFLRVSSLRRATLGEALFRPFNEHIAPLFEVVSWLAWVGARRQILATPLAFQVASYAAFGSTVFWLALWVGREVHSRTAAMVAIALFSLSSVASETVLWYSASSFQWAASATLAGLLAASRATASSTFRQRLGWSSAAGFAGLLAPGFSAIGILAGPLAAIRLVAGKDWTLSTIRRVGWSLVPLIGTAGYLVLCERFRFGELVIESVQRSFDPLTALWATVRAPSAVLFPGLIGLPEQSRQISGVGLAGASVIGLAFALNWARLSRSRSLILVSLALIVGGYFSTYATRAQPGDFWVFKIQRYHLFPQLGLIGLIAGAAAPLLRRLDSARGRGTFAAACVAILLAYLQYPRMNEVSNLAYRYPDQPRALEATVRLEELCAREGITLPQAMMALEPIQSPWFPRPWPFNPLLHLLPDGPTVPRRPDAEVRSILIDLLSPEDRESLFRGMDAGRYAVSESEWKGTFPPIVASKVEEAQAGPQGTGRPTSPVFRVSPEADDARALGLEGFRSSRGLELWWAGEGEDWSPYRSARWVPTLGSEGEAVVIPLDRLPHWRRGEVRRLRVIRRSLRPVVGGVIRFWK